MEKIIKEMYFGELDNNSAKKPLLKLDLKTGNFLRINGLLDIYIPSVAYLLESNSEEQHNYTSEEAAQIKPYIKMATGTLSQLYGYYTLLESKRKLYRSKKSKQDISNIHGCFVLHNIINSENEQIVFKKHKNEYKLHYMWSSRPLSRDTIKLILNTICDWYVPRNNDCTPWALNNRTGTCPRDIVELAASLYPASLPLIEVIDT